MDAIYAHHAGIASMIRWFGVGVFLFGVVAGIIRRITRNDCTTSN
jgi:hypothetical protein